jgi:CRP-like cAMP-binding protein
MSVLAAAGQPVPRQAVRWLARVAPFARLSPATLDDLVTAVTRIERRDGELIAAQGSEPNDLFVVGRGRVDMLLTDESGQERIVNTLNTGDAFGVSGFVSRQPRATSARAATDVILFVLSYAAFEAALERHAEPVQVLGLSGHKQPGRPVGP